MARSALPIRLAAGALAAVLALMRTFANQAALSLQSARRYEDLERLNADLERRVEERTRQLASSNARLSTSVAELGDAYRTLEASQEQLIAAQKMAAFGHLAAGIAHEMNTPLGAALNGLKVARDLLAECKEVAADPDAHRAVVGELEALVGNIDAWTGKAIAYIRSIKSHGRVADGVVALFDVGCLIERDLQPLLMHRLRLAGVTLEVRVAAELPALRGDPSRFAQVLANLINNAIDACEGLPPERARILVEATREDQDVVIAVRDGGYGIAADVRERIFDEFYTTKLPGKGTGLGLSIARDVVTGEFAGTLACTDTGPEGTTFAIRVRAREVAGEVHERSAPARAAA